MKNIISILLLFSTFSLSLTAQIRLKSELNKQDTIPAWYKNSTQKPSYALQGTHLVVETDTLYLINALRYNYYQQLQDLKELVETDNLESVALEIIKNYERALDSCKMYYKLLLKNAEKSDSVSVQFIGKTQEIAENAKKTLDFVDKRLAEADAKLKDADAKLNEAKALIKKSRRKTIFQKIAIGVGALLIGFAVGKL